MSENWAESDAHRDGDTFVYESFIEQGAVAPISALWLEFKA